MIVSVKKLNNFIILTSTKGNLSRKSYLLKFIDIDGFFQDIDIFL